MKKILLLFLFFMSISSLYANFKVNEIVLGKWGDAWYPAKIKKISGSSYSLEYMDGDSKTVPSDEIKKLNWKAGQEIQINKGDGKYKSAKIVSIQGNTIVVKFESNNPTAKIQNNTLSISDNISSETFETTLKNAREEIIEEYVRLEIRNNCKEQIWIALEKDGKERGVEHIHKNDKKTIQQPLETKAYLMNQYQDKSDLVTTFVAKNFDKTFNACR